MGVLTIRDIAALISLLLPIACGGTAAASDLPRKVDRLSGEAIMKLEICHARSRIADLSVMAYGVDSPETQTAIEEFRRCRTDAVEIVDLLMADIGPELKPDSKAEDALKDFYILWKTVLAAGLDSNASFFRERLKRLRTAEW